MATTKPKPTPPDPEASADLEALQTETEAKIERQVGDVNTPLVAPLKGTPQLYPSPAGPSYQRVETEVTIRIEPYVGFRFVCWKNAKMRVHDALYSPDFQTRVAAFHDLFLSHNGWCHPDGEPLPLMSDTENFILECPPDLYAILRDAMHEEARRVPDFPATAK